MRTAILTLILFARLTLAAPPEADLEAAEKAWAAAVVKRDFPALDRILSDRLIYAHATGIVESKSEYLNKLRSGAQRYDGIHHEKMTVRLFGDAAAVHSHVRMSGQSKNQPFDDRLMMLHLWVKRDSRWQLAAHQTTRLQ